MTSNVEKFGFALGKALKKTVDAAKGVAAHGALTLLAATPGGWSTVCGHPEPGKIGLAVRRPWNWRVSTHSALGIARDIGIRDFRPLRSDRNRTQHEAAEHKSCYAYLLFND